MSRRKPIRYDPSNDLYVVLGVLPSATLDDVRRSFRVRAKEVHPDRNPDNIEWANHQFQRLNDAYDVLNDPELRAEYDAKRRSFTHERGPDGTAWWERPHPASGPRSTGDGAANTANSASAPFTGSFDAPPMSPRSARPLRRKKQVERPYQTLFVISSLILVGSICASMTRGRVEVPDKPNEVVAAQPTAEVSPNTRIVCQSPDAAITDPPYGADVPHRFSIKGTASGPHFIFYRVDFRPFNVPNSGIEPAPDWEPLLPGEQYRPIENDVLVPEAVTASLPPGNYMIRLTVSLDDGSTLRCLWPIFKLR